jgi:predicted metalloprotease with PDZ domain
MQQFVSVRILQMNGVDVNLFQFDYDLTFAVVFLNADEQIYSRYGGRDHLSADDRISMAGLKNTMRAVLALHQKQKKQEKQEMPPPRKKTTPEDLSGVPTRKNSASCIHCHQVYEFRWRSEKQRGVFNKESLWGYPLPENIGLTLDVDRGNLVKAVAPDSAAHKAGIQAGDALETVNGAPTFSQADVQWGLFNAPIEGRFTVQLRRKEQLQTVTLEVGHGWRRTNNIWRASVRRL